MFKLFFYNGSFGGLAFFFVAMGNYRNGGDGISFANVDELYALSGTSGNTDGNGV